MSTPSAGREPAERAPRRAAVLTAAACLLVLVALLIPSRMDDVSVASFLRIPVEALAGAVVLVLLPARVARIVALVAGALLGLLVVLKALDWGFEEAFSRPFAPVSDASFLGPSVNLLAGSIGQFLAIVVVVLGVVATIGLVVLTALAVRRLGRIAAGRRSRTLPAAGAFGVLWVVLALTGVHVASYSAGEYAVGKVRQVADSLHDQEVFARELAVDAFRDRPPASLLTALKGKDVVLTFVESYSRFAIEHPDVAPKIDPLLDAGSERLRAAGLHTRSGFLTSPTQGGGSWLAHSTLHSGLWIDNPLRYETLLDGDRLTLARAFGRAGWRTVSVIPAQTEAWPEGRFYGYDKFYDAFNLGYRGPRRPFAMVPDQYTLAAFQRRERAPGHSPVMAEVDLISSHWPWDPTPQLVRWGDVGDGRFLVQPPVRTAELRTAYRDTIEYSLSAVIAYAETFADDDLVLVVLGDHRPANMVTGPGASQDVPITVITRDERVLQRIEGWEWEPGLNPSPQAPTWPMDTFRDRFLTAFSDPGA